jgi:hypothetical protein
MDVLDGSRTDMRAYLLDGSTALTANITNNYVYCGLADTPDQIPDSVSGRIALIQRGSTASAQGQGTGMFSNKVALAAAKGAIAAVIYNNVDGELASATARRSTIPAVAISKDNGEFLKSILGSTAAGAISAQQIRINQALRTSPDMADFSSRGPVLGFGQVKPDVTAPGISILSATVAVGGAETSTSTMFDPTRYISASGTSFSGPITAGIAALIKQKHPDWAASQVRAALVNTATNLRYANGTALADGANSINEQGGGLVAAAAAANIKALMGVGTSGTAGQPLPRSFGIFTQASAGNPDFTPSYSFGAVPIANVIGTATITQQVTIFDVSGGAGAGTYQLNVASVRGVDGSTFNVSFTDAGGNALSAVTVPANGSASFNVQTAAYGVSMADGAQFQWYVTASRTDGGQNLRMPFYYRAVRPTITMSAPLLNPASDTEVSGDPPIDINGSYSLAYSYTAAPAPAQYLVEEQRNGGTFTRLGVVSQTTYAISGRSNGVFNYRVAGLFAVQYGLLQGPASVVQTVQVNHRLESEVTSLIQTAVNNVSLAAGVFEFDQTLKNISSNQTILPPLRFQITGIQSTSGTVRAINADNGGNGVESPAVFDYSNTLGTDRALTVGEVSGSRHLRFRDTAAEFPDPAYLGVGRDAGSKRFKVRLRFIADPAAGSVTIAGVE